MAKNKTGDKTESLDSRAKGGEAQADTPGTSGTTDRKPVTKAKGEQTEPGPPHHGSWRETIESVAIAFILAFLFRSFEAEAFVIPTGSMATTLMGRHKDMKCPVCGYWYQASSSDEVDQNGNRKAVDGEIRTAEGSKPTVTYATCPMCRFVAPTTRRAEQAARGHADVKQTIADFLTPDEAHDAQWRSKDPPQVESPQEDPAGTSYKGDRIIVVKSYNVVEPKQWDVFVFRYPEEAATNYIKRLVGLPEHVLRIDHAGDVHQRPLHADDSAFRIARKPPDKILAMARDVYDNDYVVDAMTEAGWPPRWQPCPADLPSLVAAGWPQDQSVWPWPAVGTQGWATKDGYRTFEIAAAGTGRHWLRYQHFPPSLEQWQALRHAVRQPGTKVPPPQPLMIESHMAYNDIWVNYTRYDERTQRWQILRPDDRRQSPHLLNFVGDLILECRLVSQGKGAAILELAEGARRFQCKLDLQGRNATLSIDEGRVPFVDDDLKPAGNLRVARGAVPASGGFDVRFANVDNQLVLWINDSVVAFDAPATFHYAREQEYPFDYSPAGIASEGAPLRVERLRLRRDIYYTLDEYRSPLHFHETQGMRAAADASGKLQVVVTSRQHGLKDGDQVELAGGAGAPGPHGIFSVQRLDEDRFVLRGAPPLPAGPLTWRYTRFGTVKGVSFASKNGGPGPIVITAPRHGLNPLDHVEIRGVQGVPEANGVFLVEYLDQDRFVLVETTGQGQYQGGGQWRKINDFVLLADQFFALGDNSARSRDSRAWNEGRRFVHRDLLIGQAFFIFWPHSWDEPLPFTPNFARMGFVR